MTIEPGGTVDEPTHAGAFVWARFGGDASPYPRRWDRIARTEGAIWVSGSTFAPWSALIEPSHHPLRIVPPREG